MRTPAREKNSQWMKSCLITMSLPQLTEPLGCRSAAAKPSLSLRGQTIKGNAYLMYLLPPTSMRFPIFSGVEWGCSWHSGIMDPFWWPYVNVCLLCHLNHNALGQHAVVPFLVHVVITLNLWSLNPGIPTISYSSDIAYTTHSLNEDAVISLTVLWLAKYQTQMRKLFLTDNSWLVTAS